MGVIAEADKRQVILDATLDLVAERGLNDTPVSAIVKKSGVSTGIIYHYFADKDDLMRALYADIKQRFTQMALAGVDLDAAWDESLRRVWHNTYHFYVTHPKEMLYLDQYENSPYYYDWHKDNSPPEFVRAAQVIQAEIEAGRVKPLPFEAISVMTVGVAVVLAKQKIIGALNLDDVILDQIARATIDAIRT